jgi:hypothetical protein
MSTMIRRVETAAVDPAQNSAASVRGIAPHPGNYGVLIRLNRDEEHRVTMDATRRAKWPHRRGLES